MRTRLTRVILIAALAGLGAGAPAHATLVFQTGADPGWVWVAADDGSGARKLVPGAAPHISPDGQTVAYLSNLERGVTRLRIIPTAGGTARTLVKGWQPGYGYSDDVYLERFGTFDWSPDSRYVAVAAGPFPDSDNFDGNNRLVVADVMTGANRTVARRSFFDYASFSPDSSELVYAQRRRDTVYAKVDLHIASLADGTTRKLTHDGHSRYPVWGPEKIAFVVEKRPTGKRRRSDVAKFNLATIAGDGSGRRRLTHDKLRYYQRGLYPTDWSADGTRLLAEFESYDKEGESRSNVVTVDPLTGKERIVGKASGVLIGTALSRDGSTILGYTNDEGDFLDADNSVIGTADYAQGGVSVLRTKAVYPDWNR